MKPYYKCVNAVVWHGDCLDVLKTLPDNSFDAVVTDPPYGQEFMGREWDSFRPHDAKIRTRIDGRTNGATKSTVSTPEAYRAGMPYQSWCTTWAIECLRVLKPGGHMLAFGGTRTWHRLACAIEDAGFEVRDSIAWLYGSGFPKSLDVSKAIDKAAGAEREVVGTTRGKGGENLNTLSRNGNDSDDAKGCGAYGLGAKQVDVDIPITTPATDAAQQWQGWGTALKPAHEPIVVARKPLAGTVAANVQEYGTGALNIDGCRVETSDGYSDNAVTQGINTARSSYAPAVERRQFDPHTAGRWPPNVVLDNDAAAELNAQTAGLKQGGAIAAGSGPRVNTVFGVDTRERGEWQSYGDEGGASRFFPVFKYQAKAPNSQRPNRYGVAHPTVKPVALMSFLVRLVTPPGGVVLDPFAGSGTTAEACIDEDMHAVMIENEKDYLPMIVQRIERANRAARQRKRHEQREQLRKKRRTP